MDIQRSPPHPKLRTVLRAFEERRVDLGIASLTWPVPARPHQILNFHMAEPYRVRIDGGPAALLSEASLVGPQSYNRAEVTLTGRVHVFTVLFQPTGLNRLIGIDMSTLVDQDPSARDVLGASATLLGDAIRRAADFTARIAAVERWVEDLLERRGPDCPVALASRRLIATRGAERMSDLTARSNLSARQFQRRFTLQVGMTPKLYARTIRFDRALAARRASPDRTWTDIVHDLGYFDQAHFIRECHAFAGVAPARLVGDWDNVFIPGA